MSAPWYRVPGGTLPAIAGSVWLAAGGNVARIGALAWRGLGRTGMGYPLLALAVFGRRHPGRDGLGAPPAHPGVRGQPAAPVAVL